MSERASRSAQVMTAPIVYWPTMRSRSWTPYPNIEGPQGQGPSDLPFHHPLHHRGEHTAGQPLARRLRLVQCLRRAVPGGIDNKSLRPLALPFHHAQARAEGPMCPVLQE